MSIKSLFGSLLSLLAYQPPLPIEKAPLAAKSFPDSYEKALSFRFELLNISPSLHPDKQYFEEKKQLFQRTSQLSTQILSSIATPFPAEKSPSKLKLIKKEQEALERKLTPLRATTLSALDLDSSIHRVSEKHLPSSFDSLNVEVAKVPSCQNTSLKTIKEPQSSLELNALVQTNLSKAYSYVKTPLEYVTYSESKLSKEASVSMPRNTLKFVQNALEGFPVQTTRRLGKGSFGAVDLVQSKGDSFAVKKMLEEPTSIIGNSKQKQVAERILKKEAALYMTFDHPNIVRVEAISPEGMYLEYMKDGTLHDLIQSPTLNQEEIKQYLLDIIDALIYIHEQGYAYKDLKPENVLISKIPVQAKLCDFGFTRAPQGDTEKAGSLRYLAPEIHYHSSGKKASNSFQVDTWALGVLMFQLITGGSFPYPPLKDEKAAEYCERISRVHLDKPCNEDLFAFIKSDKKMKKAKDFLEARDKSGKIQALIKECLHGTPTKRISLEKLRSEISSTMLTY